VLACFSVFLLRKGWLKQMGGERTYLANSRAACHAVSKNFP
jgi:hypothetical protein